MKELFDIQLFAEVGGETGEATDHAEKQPDEPQVDPRDVPKYSDATLDRILKKKHAEWQERQEKDKAKEAEDARLARMNEAEKANERIRLLEERLAAADREKAVAAMTKQARAMLSDKNLHISDELLSNLIAEDAETTKASVESFISLFNSAVEKAVKDALKGETPKAGSTAKGGMTKEQILAVTNRPERQRLIKENMDLFQ